MLLAVYHNFYKKISHEIRTLLALGMSQCRTGVEHVSDTDRTPTHIITLNTQINQFKKDFNIPLPTTHLG